MKLRDYLAETGQSQRGFARRVGRREATISRLVNGLQRPGLNTILAIQRATEGAVTPADFAEDAA